MQMLHFQIQALNYIFAQFKTLKDTHIRSHAHTRTDTHFTDPQLLLCCNLLSPLYPVESWNQPGLRDTNTHTRARSAMNPFSNSHPCSLHGRDLFGLISVDSPGSAHEGKMPWTAEGCERSQAVRKKKKKKVRRRVTLRYKKWRTAMFAP